jgi:hypothetical protein
LHGSATTTPKRPASSLSSNHCHAVTRLFASSVVKILRASCCSRQKLCANLLMDKGYRLHVYKHLHLVCFDENPCRDKKQLARRFGLVQKGFRYLQRSGMLCDVSSVTVAGDLHVLSYAARRLPTSIVYIGGRYGLNGERFFMIRCGRWWCSDIFSYWVRWMNSQERGSQGIVSRIEIAAMPKTLSSQIALQLFAQVPFFGRRSQRSL